MPLQMEGVRLFGAAELGREFSDDGKLQLFDPSLTERTPERQEGHSKYHFRDHSTPNELNELGGKRRSWSARR